VDVDHPLKRICVALFQSAEPKNARDDRVPSRRIHRDDFARGLAALELHAKRRACPDLLSDGHFSKRSAITPRHVPKAKFGRGDRVAGDGVPVFKNRHALLGHADVHDMGPVACTGSEAEGQGRGDSRSEQ